MSDYHRRLQWQLTLSVFHDNRGWHIVEMNVLGCRGLYATGRVARWRGIGVPGRVLELVVAQMEAALTDHLVTRYGIQEELFPEHYPLHNPEEEV